MINIYINKILYKVPSNLTILEACVFLGFKIPHFCYNSRLLAAGNCRMCLVEINNSPKPVVACVTKIQNNMSVYLDTALVNKVREGILEFILINHPLDCPICDQGGECDLQDQSLNFGNDNTRFFKRKKAVKDKSFNFLISSIMTRCILCSKCTRFVNKFSKDSSFSLLGRGGFLEVNSYNNNIFNSEFSGNVIDLCPVGALTSSNYKFKGRPWELSMMVTYDFFDIFGSLIRVDFKNYDIFRILPIKTLEIKTSWITDVSRFSYDSFKLQRIISPMIKKNNQYKKIDWSRALVFFKTRMNLGSCLGVIGEYIDFGTIFNLKQLLSGMGSSRILLENNLLATPSYFNRNQSFRENFLFNKNKIIKSTCFIIVNLEIRFDIPSLNLLLKELYESNPLIKIYNIGKPINSLFPVINLGWNNNIFIKILEGKHFVSKICFFEKTTIFLNANNFNFNKKFYSQKNINFELINYNFTELNSYEIGLSKSSIKEALNLSKNILLLNSTKLNLKKHKKKNIIYLGFQGSINTSRSFMLLPSTSFFEKNFINLNVFGTFLNNNKVFKRYKKTRSDSSILHFLYDSLNLYNNNIKFFELNLFKNFKINYWFFIFRGTSILTKEINCIQNMNSCVLNFFLQTNYLKISNIMQNSYKNLKIHKNSFKLLRILN